MTNDEAKALVVAGAKHDFGTDVEQFIRSYAQYGTVENMGKSVEEGISHLKVTSITRPYDVFAIAYEDLARDAESEGLSLDEEFRDWKNKYGPAVVKILKAKKLPLTLENAYTVEKDAMREVAKAKKKRR